MTMPKAYDPCEGQKYQILFRNPSCDREWEHLDYAVDRKELKFLLSEYRLAYRGQIVELKPILLPVKYWSKFNGKGMIKNENNK